VLEKVTIVFTQNLFT